MTLLDDWITALNEAKYLRAPKYQLEFRSSEGYTAMGVLMDLITQKYYGVFESQPQWKCDDDTYFVIIDDEPYHAILPDEVITALNFSSSICSFKVPDELPYLKEALKEVDFTNLYYLDYLGAPFKLIARILASNPPGLFSPRRHK